MIKNSNKGFSLIEMLIAVTIMGMAAVPLAQGLVTSSQINSRALNMETASDITNSILDATQAIPAQNIIAEINGFNTDTNGNAIYDKESGEGFSFINDALKGYSIKSYNEVVPQYYCKTHKSFMDSAWCTQCNLKLSETDDIRYVSDFTGTNGSIITTGDNEKPETHLLKRENGKYYLMLNDIGSGSASFDAILEFTEVTTKAVADLTSTHPDEYVSFKIQENQDDLRAIAKSFSENNPAEDHNASWYYDHMVRKTTIEILPLSNQAKILITNDYYKNDYSAEKNNPLLQVEWIPGKVSLNQTFPVDKLQNGLYLYFSALSDKDESIRNQFVIKNTSITLKALEFPLYLIPQISGEKPYVSVEFDNASLTNGFSLIQVRSTLPKEKLVMKNGTYREEKPMGVAMTKETDFIVRVKVYEHKSGAFTNSAGKPVTAKDSLGYYNPQSNYLYVDLEYTAHNLGGTMYEK